MQMASKAIIIEYRPSLCLKIDVRFIVRFVRIGLCTRKQAHNKNNDFIMV